MASILMTKPATIPGNTSFNANTREYADRHNRFVALYTFSQMIKPGSSVVAGLLAWEAHAKGHQSRYESLIGEDYVLGPMWRQWGEGLRGLLNGECGPLDCGTLDAFILDTIRENGFTHLSSGDELCQAFD